MRVGVDGRSLVATQARGILQYTSALLGALAVGFPDDEWRLLLARTDGPGALPPALRRPNVVSVRHPLPRRLLYGAVALGGRPRLDRALGGVDVLWAPAIAPVAHSPDVPLVLTVHDLSFEDRPLDFTRYERMWHRLTRPPALAAAAARVMVDAEATRADIVSRWSLDPERVRIVRPGVDRPAQPVDPEAVERMRGRRGIARRYLLFVGALEPRKAPDLLVRAFAAARARGLDAELVMAGEGRLAPALAAAGVHVLGRVDADELAALYAGALALVLPSHLEGFGFTPLEALAHGTPTVASDLAVLRETMGDRGALWVPAGDGDALAAALAHVARDAGLRSGLVEAATLALERLTWERAAREARAVLAEAADR